MSVACITRLWGKTLRQDAVVQDFVRESPKNMSFFILALDKHARRLPARLPSGRSVTTQFGPIRIVTRCSRRGFRTHAGWYDTREHG